MGIRIHRNTWRAPLQLIDSPGHARHHHAIWDARSRSWFTGDTFGLSYRNFDVDGRAWILPTTTPVQFDPEALRATVARLLAAEPEAMLVTHYGRIGGSVAEVRRLADEMLAQVDEMVALAGSLRDAPDRHARLRDRLLAGYLERLRAHGHAADAQAAEWLGLDAELNAQGLEVWLDRPAR